VKGIRGDVGQPVGPRSDAVQMQVKERVQTVGTGQVSAFQFGKNGGVKCLAVQDLRRARIAVGKVNQIVWCRDRVEQRGQCRFKSRLALGADRVGNPAFRKVRQGRHTIPLWGYIPPLFRQPMLIFQKPGV